MNQLFKLTSVGLVIIALLIVFHWFRWLAPAENFLIRVLSPAQQGLHGLALGSRSFYDAWLAKRDLLGENARLKEQLQNYQLDQSRLESLAAENATLKNELGFVQEKKLKYVAAQIITGVSDPLSQSVVVNRGGSDGLVKGLAVTAEGGILVGKITEVGDNYSKVLLLIDNQSKVAATLQNLNRTAGLVEGQFGLSFTMTNIPQDQAVKEGDLVVTSGLEGQIPKGLLIAKVESVSLVAGGIFQTAILSPIASFKDLSDVVVIIP